MFRWRGWLVLIPFVTFVATALLMSCGGGGGGVVQTPSPPGPFVQAIAICPGPPPSPSPVPTVPPTATPAPTASPATTACPAITSTFAVPTGTSTVSFNAQATLSDGTRADTSNTALWTTSDSSVVSPQGNGLYDVRGGGTASIQASVGGVASQSVSVAVCTSCSPSATARPLSPEQGQGPQGGGSAVLQWTLAAGGPIRGRVLANSSGTALAFVSSDSILHSVASNGIEIFRRPVGGSLFVAGPNDSIYAAGLDDYLYALGPSGSVLWRTPVGGGAGALAQGKSLFAAAGGALLALDHSGRVQWRSGVGEVVAAAAAADGSVVAGVASGAVVSFSSAGAERWSFMAAGGFLGTAVINIAGTSYFGSADGLYAVDSSGHQRWHFATPAPVVAGPSAAPDGQLFFVADKLYALDSPGNELWSAALDAPGPSAPTVTSDGAIFVGGADGSASLFGPGGAPRWSAKLGGPVLSTAAAIGGLIYVGADDGRLYAIRYR